MTSPVKKVPKAKTTPRKSGLSRDIDDAFEKVPFIGEVNTRWYDIPYKILLWSLKGWRRKCLPQSTRSGLNRWLNNLLQLNEHDRQKATNYQGRLIVPVDEHIAIPSIWVVELFSPNETPNLGHAIKKNGWDKKRRWLAGEEGNIEALNHSRAGKGYRWWKLAKIVNTNIDEAKYYVLPDSIREKLPSQFVGVHLKAIQVGAGLTAIVARFNLAEEAIGSLDKVWHDKHDPMIVRENGRLHPKDGEAAAYQIVQSARKDLHDAARSWMTKRCPGFFASNGEQQLVMDLILTSKYDPTSSKLPDHNFLSALMALDIDAADFYRNTAKELPKMLFMPSGNFYPRILDSSRTWSLIGKREAVKKAFNNFIGQAGDINQGSSHYSDEYASKTLLMLSVTELLSVLENKYAVLRDEAKLQHGAFKVQHLERLSESLLSLSFTLSSVKRDLERLKGNNWTSIVGSDFTTKHAPHFVARDKKLKGKSTNMTDTLQTRQMKKLEDLIKADEDYRNILSTVASLGASANSIKLGKTALYVAGLSLVVTAAALIVQLNTSETQQSTKIHTNVDTTVHF